MIDFRNLSSNIELKTPENFKNENLIKDEIFREAETEITEIDIDKLVEYSKNPFKPYDGEKLEQMIDSIKKYGIVQAIVVRKIKDSDKYEILSGHNRFRVAKFLANEDKRFRVVPIRVLKNIDDETAEVIVSESNLMQRSLSDLAPSEKAFIIAKYHNAIKKQGSQGDIVKEVAEILNKKEENINLEKEYNLSKASISMYTKINDLIEEFKKDLDNKIIDVRIGYEIAKLDMDKQKILHDYCINNKAKITRKNIEEIKSIEEFNNENLIKIFTKNKKEKKTNFEKIIKNYLPNNSDAEIREILNLVLDYYVKGKI